MQLHSQSCGLKAFCTEESVLGTETCRRACGGHGFTMSSGVAEILSNALGSVTFEGENTVLYQQTARWVEEFFRNVHEHLIIMRGSIIYIVHSGYSWYYLGKCQQNHLHRWLASTCPGNQQSPAQQCSSTGNLEFLRKCHSHSGILCTNLFHWHFISFIHFSIFFNSNQLSFLLNRYLVKSYTSAQSGKRLPLSVSYLALKPSPILITTEQDCLDLGQLCQAFRCRAYQ